MADRPEVGVAVIVRRNNKVLIHKRKSSHSYGKWGFPGGHFEKWETFEECALRELREEAGNVKVTTPKYWTIQNTSFYEEDKHVVVLFMICDWISGEAEVMEPDKCDSWEWRSWYNLPQPLMPGIQSLVEKEMNPFFV